MIAGTAKNLGFFETEEEAKQAYDLAAIKIGKRQQSLNFPHRFVEEEFFSSFQQLEEEVEEEMDEVEEEVDEVDERDERDEREEDGGGGGFQTNTETNTENHTAIPW